MARAPGVLLSAATLLLATACSKAEPGKPAAGPGAAAFRHENTAENLRAFFTELQAAIRAGDTAKAAALTKDVLPDRDRLAKGLNPESGDAVEKAWAVLGRLIPGNDEAAAGVFRTEPVRTEVRVWGATTEEIAAYEDGSVAFNEFPGGTRKLAEAGVLRPGVTFYEVEVVEPGKDSGMKYHLFFFDGDRWTMMGPIWRGF